MPPFIASVIYALGILAHFVLDRNWNSGPRRPSGCQSYGSALSDQDPSPPGLGSARQ